MNELISIIIPVYNAEKFLKRCIESVINQTYKNIEIILIDDGSTDDSFNICQKYMDMDSRIIAIHKENQGVSFARNEGIRISKGIYITFIDSDDWIEKNEIEVLYKKLKEKNVDIVRGNYYQDDDNGIYKHGNLLNFENTIIGKNDKIQRNELLKNILNGKFLSYVWLLLIKKSLLTENNIMFKENIVLMEDTIFYTELCSLDNSIYIYDSKLYHYYDNNKSATKSIENIERNIDCILKVNKILKDVVIKRNMSKKEWYKIIDTTHSNLIMNLFFNMYKRKSKKLSEVGEKIKQIIENKDFQIILNNAEFHNIPIHFKIQYWYIKRKKISFLLFFYRIRKILSNFKDIIFNRK